MSHYPKKVEQRYRCNGALGKGCGWEGTEKEMEYEDDYYYYYDGDGSYVEGIHSFTVCPKCGFWHYNTLWEEGEWIKI